MITILFDLDGTLIDSTEAILLSFHDSFSEFGDKLPDDNDIISLIGHPLDFMYKHLGVPADKVWDYVDVYKRHYRQRSKSMTKLLPNAKNAVEEAAKFAKLGIVTTKTGRYSKELLEHMQILHYFEVLIGREDVINPKPHPEPVIKALKAINSSPENSWMIGDTCMDVVSASDAGVKSVALLSGYGTREDLCKCSNHIKKDAFESIKFIRNFYN